MNFRSVAFGDVGPLGGRRGASCCSSCERQQSSQLGDIICTQAEYSAAADAVGTLHNLMQQAPPAVQDQFKAQVNALLQTWNTDTADYQSRWIKTPFYLCHFKDLGQQAQDLAQQIAAATGKAPVVKNKELNPGASESVGDSVKQLGKVLVGAIAVFAGVEVFKAARRRRARVA